MQAERLSEEYNVTSYYDQPKNASIVWSFCIYNFKLGVWIGWYRPSYAHHGAYIRYGKQRVA